MQEVGRALGSDTMLEQLAEVKPLLRGWLHAFAAVGAVAVTAGLLARTSNDLPRLISALIFGLSMIGLYLVSSVYHLGSWQGRRDTILRTCDHANIFLLIAGTYTPICVNVLEGSLRIVMLVLIWSLAAAGIFSTVWAFRLPRWALTARYLGMGSVGLIALPALFRALPLQATALILAGWLLYTGGAVIYILRRPNPLPRYFGFHELFHLCVIAGNAAFVLLIWGWVLPFGPS